jgi:hypothetical protein
MLNETLSLNTSASLQISLAVEAHLAKGQFLLKCGQKQRKFSDEFRGNSKINSFQERRTEFRTKVNFNKEECFKLCKYENSIFKQ